MSPEELIDFIKDDLEVELEDWQKDFIMNHWRRDGFDRTAMITPLSAKRGYW